MAVPFCGVVGKEADLGPCILNSDLSSTASSPCEFGKLQNLPVTWNNGTTQGVEWWGN